MESVDYNNFFIPREIFFHILSFLPVKSLLRFRTVSKEWKLTIDHPDFASLHVVNYTHKRRETNLILVERHVERHRDQILNRCIVTEFYRHAWRRFYRLRPSEPLAFTGLDLSGLLKVVGNVDGLNLVVHTKPDLWTPEKITLWNPSIKKCLEVPLPPSQPDHLELCLGFDPSTNDYKVVNIIQDYQHVVTFEIFSLKSCLWRKGHCHKGGNVSIACEFDHTKLYLAGSVHWVGGVLYAYNDVHKGFVSFNLTSETFSCTTLPDVLYEDHYIPRFLMPTAVTGSSLVGLLSSCEDSCDIWVLQQDGGWSKTFSMNFETIGHVNKCVLNKNGVLIGAANDYDKMFAYDTCTGEKIVLSKSFPWWPCNVNIYVESLVLLNQGKN